MPSTTLPPRSEIAEECTWNAPSVFESPDAWAAELKALAADIAPFREKYEGHLGDGPALLADYFDDSAALSGRFGKVYVYAGMFSSVDTADQDAAAMFGQVMGLYGQFRAATAFTEPELLAVGLDRLTGWLDSEPRLGVYRHYIEDLFRQQAHVRSAEVEEVIGMLADPFATISETASKLANADLKFAPATTADGEQVSVEQGNIITHVHSPDRVLRRSSYESYTGGYLAFKNTFASNLTAIIKRDVFMARVHKHPSSLAAALHPYNLPETVFHNLIAAFKQNLPTWHRYWDVRRRVLGVETLHPYDVWAPLT
ncbi:MAG: oligoendopeptidase F, partial [Anaerolineae bacterium]|nr:oligoendopeptidase F [Anaerolineae bacterium]